MLWVSTRRIEMNPIKIVYPNEAVVSGEDQSTLRDAIGYLGGGLISRSFSIRAMGETQPRPREPSAPILECLVSNPPKRT
jgi:hypothetical protein